MFKKLSSDTKLKQTQCKSSVQRALTKQVAEQYEKVLHPKELAYIIDKDSSMFLAKVPDTYIQLMIQRNQVLFFQEVGGKGAGPWMPHLRVLHAFPFILPKIQCDEGGIRHMVDGANVMVPGLITPGGRLPDENVPAGSPVAIHCEGMEHAASVGVLTMDTDDIKKATTGVATTTYHNIGDGLWTFEL